VCWGEVRVVLRRDVGDGMDRPIVVGIDGSPGGLAAVEWAMLEGRLRGLPVRLVYALRGRYREVTERDRTIARDRLGEALKVAGSVTSKVVPTGDIVPGQPIAALVEASESAAFVVTGSRGMTAVPGLPLGSVSRRVAEYAHCDVVVVPEPRAVTYRTLVVGMDGSPGAELALEFAFQEAALRGSELRVVHAYHPVVPFGAADPSRDGVSEEARWLTDRLATWTAKYPGVPVRTRVVPGNPVFALAATAVHADLLVVGARGRGGFRGLRLGAVGQGVLNHCPAPIAVVRDGHRP